MNPRNAVQLSRALVADAGGNLPTEIEIARVGKWETPRHGNFELTMADFEEAIRHFNDGVHRVKGTEPLAATLDHLGGDSPAAYRFGRLFIRDDALWAGDITWTELGKEKLKRDEYRYTSFEFWPRSMPYTNPENKDETLVNVVTGATLTNDPLFKKLSPVLASARAGTSDKSNHKGDSMNLDELRSKKKDELNKDELKFLEERKADLTEDERKTFGFEQAPAKEDSKGDTPKEPTAEENEAKQLQASIKAGTHVIVESKAYQGLQASVQALESKVADYEREKVRDGLNAHVARGAIKSDDVEKWTDKIMHDASLADLVAALPDGERVNASVRGDGGDTHANASAALNAKVTALMASDKLDYNAALSRVRQDDPNLYAQYQAEVTGGNQ